MGGIGSRCLPSGAPAVGNRHAVKLAVHTAAEGQRGGPAGQSRAASAAEMTQPTAVECNAALRRRPREHRSEGVPLGGRGRMSMPPDGLEDGAARPAGVPQDASSRPGP